MNEAFEKREEAFLLFEMYKSLLTTSQREIFSLYYLSDLSLSEIALELNISRAAVSDSLKKSMLHLEEYEDNLRLLKKKEKLRELIEEEKKSNNDKIESLERIKEEIENGI